MSFATCHVSDIATSVALPAMAALLAALSGPDTRDAWAMTGAMLGTVIAVIEARKKDRSLASTISVVIASAFTGTVAPGAVVALWFPEFSDKINWQIWSGCGFAAALVGWGFILAFMKFFVNRAPKLIESLSNRFFGQSADSTASKPEDKP